VCPVTATCADDAALRTISCTCPKRAFYKTVINKEGSCLGYGFSPAPSPQPTVPGNGRVPKARSLNRNVTWPVLPNVRVRNWKVVWKGSIDRIKVTGVLTRSAKTAVLFLCQRHHHHYHFCFHDQLFTNQTTSSVTITKYPTAASQNLSVIPESSF
jgi:hypothetical protein